MSLARAFTKRIQRPDAMGRIGSIRNQISSPVALLSTTNMLSYDAPDIATLHINTTDGALSTASSAPSTPGRQSSDNDSDGLTPSTVSTDASSVESSPRDESNHLSSYFRPGPDTVRKAAEVEDIPVLPSRAPSHSKREHERLARKRSLQCVRPASAQSMRESVLSRSNSELRHSCARTSTNDKLTVNPFSQELAQLNEVVEEFGATARDVAAEEDTAVMQSRGLMKFGLDDYLQEIQPLWSIVFAEIVPPANSPWI